VIITHFLPLHVTSYGRVRAALVEPKPSLPYMGKAEPCARRRLFRVQWRKCSDPDGPKHTRLFIQSFNLSFTGGK